MELSSLDKLKLPSHSQIKLLTKYQILNQYKKLHFRSPKPCIVRQSMKCGQTECKSDIYFSPATFHCHCWKNSDSFRWYSVPRAAKQSARDTRNRNWLSITIKDLHGIPNLNLPQMTWPGGELFGNNCPLVARSHRSRPRNCPVTSLPITRLLLHFMSAIGQFTRSH